MINWSELTVEEFGWCCDICHEDQSSGNLDWTKQCLDWNDNCRNFRKIKLKEPKEQKLVFITIQDFQRRITDLDKMRQFIKKCEYIFSECYWCIESGKVPLPDSNLHIHMLCKYNNSKKGKNQLCIEWSKLFDTNLRDSDYYLLRQHRDCNQMPSYQQWVEEKLEYFENEKKGNHENVIDLDARGQWG